jgi:hypothetical protein
MGRLDRRDGDATGSLVRVSDYKHTRNESSLRLPLRQADLGVTAFQIPLYLAGALAQAGNPLAEVQGRVVPTALVGKKVGSLVYAPGDGFLAADAPTRQARAQAGEPNLFNAISELWQRLLAGDLVPRPDKSACAHCDFAGLCRARAVAGEAEDAAGEGGDA